MIYFGIFYHANSCQNPTLPSRVMTETSFAKNLKMYRKWVCTKGNTPPLLYIIKAGGWLDCLVRLRAFAALCAASATQPVKGP